VSDLQVTKIIFGSGTGQAGPVWSRRSRQTGFLRPTRGHSRWCRPRRPPTALPAAGDDGSHQRFWVWLWPV